MASWQQVVLWFLIIVNALLFIKGKQECRKRNSFGLTRQLSFLGMFVWGDVLLLSVFWIISAVLSLLFSDWMLFLVIVSTFWLIRSVGETLYWFLQQFAMVKRDPPESLVGYSLVKNESIWFLYQVLWQCLAVFSLISTVYLFHVWLSGS